MKERIVLFSHFSKSGELPTCSRRMLLSIKEQGWVFIVISNFLNSEALEWCKLQGMEWILRDNKGRDFGAFQHGLFYLKQEQRLANCIGLILLNDSVYLRCDYLQSSWVRFLNGLDDTLLAITDSYQNGYHLQSYALNIPPLIFNSTQWHNFWRLLNISGSTAAIIRNGEIELSAHLLRAGFKLKALHPVLDLRRLSGSTQFFEWLKMQLDASQQRMVHDYIAAQARVSSCIINPSHQLVITSLFDGAPLVKRDLLEANPSAVPDPFFFASSVDWFDSEEMVGYLKPPFVGFKGSGLIQKILRKLYNFSTRIQR